MAGRPRAAGPNFADVERLDDDIEEALRLAAERRERRHKLVGELTTHYGIENWPLVQIEAAFYKLAQLGAEEKTRQGWVAEKQRLEGAAEERPTPKKRGPKKKADTGTTDEGATEGSSGEATFGYANVA